MNSGYTLFIRDNKLHHDYNYFNIERMTIVSPVLRKGSSPETAAWLVNASLPLTGKLATYAATLWQEKGTGCPLFFSWLTAFSNIGSPQLLSKDVTTMRPNILP